MIKQHDHVDSCLLIVFLIYQRVKRYQATRQVVESRARNKFIIHSNKLGWLAVNNVELEINYLKRIYIQIACYQIKKTSMVLLKKSLIRFSFFRPDLVYNST